jgi:galactose mutarotase-like enzyme
MSADLLTVQNEHLLVEICPTQGADIRKVARIGRSENLLLETKWEGSETNYCDCDSDSNDEIHFLSHYSGGWQLMIPNAGFPSSSKYGPVGYHGEAWSNSWSVIRHNSDQLIIETSLKSAPIKIQRKVSLNFQTLEVTDLVTNTSNAEIEILWGHHPAFSNLLFDNSTEVHIFAAEIEVRIDSNVETTDTLLRVIDQQSDSFILRDFAKAPQSFLGFATKFKNGRATILNQTNQLCVNLIWDSAIFPHAWVWIENRNILEKPWEQSIITLAIEPCTTKNNMGIEESMKEPNNVLVLKGKKSKSTTIYLEVLNLPALREDFEFTLPKAGYSL